MEIKFDHFLLIEKSIKWDVDILWAVLDMHIMGFLHLRMVSTHVHHQCHCIELDITMLGYLDFFTALHRKHEASTP